MTVRQRTLAVIARIAQLPPKLLSLSLLATALILIPTFILLASSFDTAALHNAVWAHGSIRHAKGAKGAVAGGGLREELLRGGVVMPKLNNATAKAELGRASWLLLHTTAARFPEHPDEDEREAFKNFLFLFSRVYPCGECAAEFQAILKKHPPQTSSRNAASMYMCYVHNLVNARLDKPIFDCSSGLEGIYDCGCAEDEADAKGGTGNVNGEVVEDGEGGKRDPLTGEEMMGG